MGERGGCRWVRVDAGASEPRGVRTRRARSAGGAVQVGECCGEGCWGVR